MHWETKITSFSEDVRNMTFAVHELEKKNKTGKNKEKNYSSTLNLVIMMGQKRQGRKRPGQTHCWGQFLGTGA